MLLERRAEVLHEKQASSRPKRGRVPPASSRKLWLLLSAPETSGAAKCSCSIVVHSPKARRGTALGFLVNKIGSEQLRIGVCRYSM